MHKQIPESVYTIFSRHLTSLPKLRKIPSKYRPQVIKEAQQAVTDYLHLTRSVPYAYAEHITKNSLYNLYNLISNVCVTFSAPNFSNSLQKFLRYHPINEFEFFFESIGIDYREVTRFLPSDKFFLSDDRSVFNAACALSAFGFPWNKLGMLYKEEISIFSKSQKDLISRLRRFKSDYGFDNVTVIGVCLAFPRVLGDDGELNGEIGALFDDLKSFFVDIDLVGCVEGNVDAWYKICRKIQVFYDLGCEKGKLGELMGRSKSLFLDYTEDVLVQKVEYFCGLGVRTVDVGLLLLKSPEILSFDLETQVISVEGLLKHFGLSETELKFASENYPHVLGRNKMANLPHVMRALNLQDWFFNKINNGNHQELENYAISNPDEDLNEEYRDSLKAIQSSRLQVHTLNKLKFLHGIGYGENALTIKVLPHLHGTKTELEERLDSFLRSGIEFAKVCRMIRLSPKIMNQNPETIEQKLNFLCYDMGTSLDYLDLFPSFVCFDLEYRIKPRYRFHVWLIEKGLCTKNYSIASLIATSEKSFLARIHGIHPAAPKVWFECFLCKRPSNSSSETLIS